MTPRPPTRRDLTRPVLFSGDAGDGEVTILTGGNVGLAPEAVARALEGVPWGAPGRRPDPVPLVAFARTRHGLAGAWGGATGAAAVAFLGTFGRPEGLDALGAALGAYLADRDRFPGGACVRLPEGPGAAALGAALEAAGVPAPPGEATLPGPAGI